MANLIGKIVGKYKLIERLGSGGMAEVYKAYHPKLERFVSIKILHSYLAEGEDFLTRFEREAKAVASLRHPHIVQIHDFDVEDDNYYMVMDYIDGGTLHARMVELSKKSLYMPIDQVLSILRQVADALDYAHQKGIIHRDIKPSNILLDSAGNAFLSDFGIARIIGGTQLTSTGSLIGTPTYMSPEQGKGDELTTVSDIYSLGVILYELLTGKVPFSSDTTPLAIIHKHLTETPPEPRLLRPGLPAEAEQVILKALAKDPRQRYQSAGEMVQALEKALGGEAAAALDAAASPGVTSRQSRPTELIETSPPDRSESPTELVEAIPPDRANLPTIPTGLMQAPKAPPPAAPAGVDKAKGIGPSKKRPLLWIAAGMLGVLVVAGALIKIVPAMRPPVAVPTKKALLLPSSTPVPTREVLNPASTPTVFTTETPTPLPTSVFYDDFSNPAVNGGFNPDLWETWQNGASSIAFTQQDGMLSIQQTAGAVALIASTYSGMPLDTSMYIEAKVRLAAPAGHAYVGIMESNFGVVCSLFTSGQKGSVLCYDPLSSIRLGDLPVDSSQDWHDIRLEVTPDTMTFTASVDGQPLFSAVPPNALKYQKSAFSFRIGLYDTGAAVGYFKDVMIGVAGK